MNQIILRNKALEMEIGNQCNYIVQPDIIFLRIKRTLTFYLHVVKKTFDFNSF